METDNQYQIVDNRRQMLVDNLQNELQNVNNLRAISDKWGETMVDIAEAKYYLSLEEQLYYQMREDYFLTKAENKLQGAMDKLQNPYDNNKLNRSTNTQMRMDTEDIIWDYVQDIQQHLNNKNTEILELELTANDLQNDYYDQRNHLIDIIKGNKRLSKMMKIEEQKTSNQIPL